jgi:hypothetical protein
MRTNVPVAVTTSIGALWNKTVVAIAAGDEHSLALCSDGTVVSWGYNSHGQLGNGNTTGTSIPVAVTTATALSNKTVVDVDAGHEHSVALCSDGTVASWGYNFYGQLGNDNTTDSSVPVPLTAGRGVLLNSTIVAITAGGLHTLGLAEWRVQQPRFTRVEWTLEGFRMVLQGGPSETLQIEWNKDSSPSGWQPLGSGLTDESGVLDYTDVTVFNQMQQRFYRAVK